MSSVLDQRLFPQDNPKAFRQIYRAFLKFLDPQDEFEYEIADQLAMASLQRQRALCLEAALWAHLEAEIADVPLVQNEPSLGPPTTARWQRRRPPVREWMPRFFSLAGDRHARSFHRAALAWHRLKKAL